MKLRPFASRTLTFTIDDTDYEVGPVAVDAGMELVRILDDPKAQKATKYTHLFELALGDTWAAMVADKVPLDAAWRAGLAALTHFQVLTTLTGPDAWQQAEEAAAAVWESGVDPESLAAYMAARLEQTSGTASTKRSTRTGGAATTRSSKSGITTTTRKPRTERRSSGRGGRSTGRSS